MVCSFKRLKTCYHKIFFNQYPVRLAEQINSEAFVLGNGRVKVKVTDKGHITSLNITTEEGVQRELIPDGEFAGFVRYDDRPNK